MQVLVTGGTGYLGSALVRALVRGGHEPVVFARHATAAAARQPAVRAIDGDIRDTRAVTAAAAGVDAICHAAALVALWRRDPSEFDAVNVGGLQSVLSATREHGLRRLVYTSSFLALPPADSPHPLTANHYQRTKVAARDVARRATSDGSPVVTLYPGVIYGPGPATEGDLVGRLMRDHRAGRLPGVIGPERRWSFSFVEDVADAHVAALTHASPAREYVVGGVNAPQQAIYDFLRDHDGRPLPRRLPYGVAMAAAAAQEAYASLRGRAPLITRGVVEIFGHDWSLDSTAAQTDLGLRITSLKDGLARTLAAL
ncbi:MAG TPA: NAD-dependent epimerase/dehydratase family protein [Vicinamibacterales bacterium]|nr:NAD-dependent epimerase/dehydratase family protein [Vicinamibacterales bacterium]